MTRNIFQDLLDGYCISLLELIEIFYTVTGGHKNRHFPSPRVFQVDLLELRFRRFDALLRDLSDSFRYRVKRTSSILNNLRGNGSNECDHEVLAHLRSGRSPCPSKLISKTIQAESHSIKCIIV